MVNWRLERLVHMGVVVGLRLEWLVHQERGDSLEARMSDVKPVEMLHSGSPHMLLRDP